MPATHLCIDAIDACVFPGNLQELQNDFKNTAFGEYVSFYLAGRAAHGMLQEEPGEFRHDKSECSSLASMVFSVHVLCVNKEVWCAAPNSNLVQLYFQLTFNIAARRNMSS